MEGYGQLSQETSTRGSFLYAAPVLAPNSSLYARSSTGSNLSEHQRTTLPISTFRLESGQCFQTEPDPAVKTEVSTSQHVREFQHPLIREQHQTVHHHHHQRQEQGRNGSSSDGEAIKAKIIAHPQYPKLVEAYMDCQGVGAPSEVATQLTAIRREFEIRQRSSAACREISKDPELDQFMEAYCDMLVKYRDELTRPLQEAMEFIRRIESQLNMLSHGPIQIFSSDDKFEGIDSSEEDQENSAGETELPEIGPHAGDKELKNHLLKKYSGYLSSLKQELSKKKKKGKLPKEARQKLLSWWEMHYKWPYPSETEKVALAEATGLDQKQINNWFINQRKRHWKPSEDMQFMVMDGIHPQSAAFYMEGNFMGGASFHLGP